MNGTAPWGGSIRREFKKQPGRHEFSPDGIQSPPLMANSRPCVSRSVRWYDFHLCVQERLDAAGDYPMAGTQAWFDLDDADPRKTAAVLAAASMHIQRVEACQIAECEASHAISAAADWGEIAQYSRDRGEFAAQHPWAARRAAS
jgi:hypothetical protein